MDETEKVATQEEIQADADTQPDPQPDPKPEEPQQDQASVAAVIAERRRAQKVQEQFDEYKETVEARLEQMELRSDDDVYLDEQPDKRIDNIEKMLKDDREERVAMNKAAQAQSEVAALENQFRSGHEDYDQAVQFLQEHKLKEYNAIGLPADDAMKQFAQDARSMTERALDSGRNPAEVAYQLARALGFEATEKSNGKSKTLDNVAQAQGASLADASGGEVKEGRLTADELAGLSEQEFNDYLDKHGDRAFNDAFA